MPTVQIPKDHSIARVMWDTLEMESLVMVNKYSTDITVINISLTDYYLVFFT